MRAFIELCNQERSKAGDQHTNASFCNGHLLSIFQILSPISHWPIASWRKNQVPYRKHPAMSPQINAVSIFILFPKGTCSPNGYTCTQVTTQWGKGILRYFEDYQMQGPNRQIPRNPKWPTKETMFMNKILIQGHLTVGPIGPWTHSVVISLAPE